MPQINDITTAKDLGRKTQTWRRFIWHACIDCGKERWVLLVQDLPRNLRCHTCSNKLNPFQDGRALDGGHYITVKLMGEDLFFSPMLKANGYVKEHRLVMAKSLGRCLQPWELVHHKNGNRQDNRLENLELTTNGAHTLAHNKGYKDGYSKGLYDGHEKRIKQLETRVAQLETENVILKSRP